MEGGGVSRGLGLIEYLFDRWRSRWLLRGLFVLACGLLAFGLSYLSRPYFASEVKMVYVEDTSTGLAEFMSSGSAAGALRSLGIGGSGSGVMLPEILRSRSMLSDVLSDTVEFDGRRQPLYRVYLDEEDPEPHAFDKTLDKFREAYLQAVYDNRTDVVRLQVLAPGPELAADLANRIAEKLNTRLVSNSTERARRQKSFIEDRLGQVKAELEQAETVLKNFRLENRAIQDSPSLRMQEGRYMREVMLGEQLFTTLAAQYELARIEEVKNLPVIDVIDPAAEPYRKAKPRRAFRLAAGLLAGLVLLLVWDAGRFFLEAEEVVA